MGNELIPQDMVGGELANQSFSDLTSSDNEYFNRLQLYGQKSNKVAEGDIEANHYGIPMDDGITDLGAEVDVALLAWRPKALHTGTDPIVECFDAESAMFESIKQQAGVKDSGAMYGPEFLLYVPDVKMFVTYFMSSKTARREARKMEPLLRQAVTLKSKVIKQGKFIWTGPVVIGCSSPIEMADMELTKKKINQFLNPPKQEIEKADDSSGRER